MKKLLSEVCQSSVGHVAAWSLLVLASAMVLVGAYSLTSFSPEVAMSIPASHHQPSKVLGVSTSINYSQLGESLSPLAGQDAAQPQNPVQKPLQKKIEKGAAMSVTIGTKGRINMSGTIVSLGDKSLGVKSWGGIWTVNLSGSTTNNAASQQLALMAKGDAVNVSGIVDENSLTVNSATVKDTAVQQRRAQVSGNISNAAASGFTLTMLNKKTVQISFSDSVKVTVNGKQAAVTDIAAGMRVAVTGSWNADRTSVLAVKVEAKSAIKSAAKKVIVQPVPTETQSPMVSSEPFQPAR